MRNRHQPHCAMGKGGDCCTCDLTLPSLEEIKASRGTAKSQLLKPRLLESIDRLRKFVELDVPAVILGAEAWNVFQTVLATYGTMAASTMVQSIRDKNLQMRAICAHEDCTNYVDRPPLGMCKTCLAALGLPHDAEEITPDGEPVA